MTDLEITRRCAEAMGYKIELRETPFTESGVKILFAGEYDLPVLPPYNPLHNDAQAMALVKKFRLHSIPDHDREGWWDVFAQSAEKASVYGTDQDLNRAICECVAKLKQGEGR